MSFDPGDQPSPLSALADAYEPTDADAERVLAKIEASLASGAIEGAPPPPAGVVVSKKTALVGVTCAAVFASAIGLYSARDAAAPASVEPAVAHVVEDDGAARPPLADPPQAAEPAVSVHALPTADAPIEPPRALPRAVAPPRGSGEADDALQREARLLASARRASKAGEASRALALLDQHAKTFPDGWLASDRAAERIVVLCTLGRRDEARREAAVFLDGRAESPLTRRVASSCAGQP